MIQVAAVSYLNTIPFIYGFKRNNDLMKEINLKTYSPSECLSKILNNEADIGLIPVAGIPLLNNPHIVSNYCIGACGKVKTVLLLSDVPLNEIETILLDYQSRTSVNLVKILAEKYWKINPEFTNAEKGFEGNFNGTTAGVVIGDRTFALISKYKYIYDLSDEWTKFTAHPFVFATWTANKQIDENILKEFNSACEYGISHIDEAVSEFHDQINIPLNEAIDYLKNNISYSLDPEKRNGMNLFLDYLKKV